MAFEVEDLIFVKVSPLKRVVRFESSGKLALIFVEPFSVLEMIWSLAYRVELLEKMAEVHNVFHVSYLCKCVHNPTTVIASGQLKEVKLESEPSSSRGPTCIVERRVK